MAVAVGLAVERRRTVWARKLSGVNVPPGVVLHIAFGCEFHITVWALVRPDSKVGSHVGNGVGPLLELVVALSSGVVFVYTDIGLGIRLMDEA